MGGEVQGGESLEVTNEGERSMKDKRESDHVLASVAQLVSSHPRHGGAAGSVHSVEHAGGS